MNRRLKKALALAACACMLLASAGCGGQTNDVTTTPETTSTPTVTSTPTAEPTAAAEALKTLDNYSGTTAASTGTITDKAVLWEKGTTLAYDETIGMNAVHFAGSDDYLELPEDIFEDTTEAFTIAFMVKNDADTDAAARIFQANLCGYSVGDKSWMDAPEISISADGTVRIFAGGRTISGVYNPVATYNNGGSSDDKAYAEPYGHKTRYTGTAAAFSADSWTEIVFSVSKDGFKVFANGTEITYTEPASEEGNVASTLEYLFGDYTNGTRILKDYVNISFANSVYSDSDDYKGSVANIRFYNKAVTPAELADTKADYCWDFSASTLSYNEMTTNYTADLTKYKESTALTEVLNVVSPSGNLTVNLLKDDNGSFYYNVMAGDTVIVENSALGFVFDGAELKSGLTVSGTETAEINETYDTITGSSATATNHCNETKVTLAGADGSFVLALRAYDDGVAYKYEDVTVGSAENVTVSDELSEIVFTPNITTWSFALNATYEGEYVKRSANSFKSLASTLSTPLLVQEGDYYVLVTEANVFNNDGQYCSSAIKTVSGSIAMDWTFGLKRDPSKESTGELDSPGHLTITSVSTNNGFDTPWRTLVISNDLNTFTTTDIISNLNPAYDTELFADTSWIKPGVVAWSWWSADSSQGNYRTHQKYIDFASENGWEYVCMDAYWRNFESRLSEICAYAKEKNVGLFVWVNYRDIKDPDTMDSLFKKWAEAGVVGLKTDYFESDDCNVLLTMQQVAETAAKYHLMVLYHGCVRPGGEYRTYPNIVTMEAVQGEENHKWSRVPTIYNSLLYPFTRNICGSMDYTPTGCAISTSDATNAFELAMTVVYESGLQHMAYSATGYAKYNGLSFINHVPTTWDESILIDGEPGEYATFARRNGDEWYLGTMTNAARTLNAKLDFLGEGSYNAYIYTDSADGETLVISKQTVTAADTLTLDLLANGGATVIFTKNDYTDITLTADESQAETPESNYTTYEAESDANTLSGSAVVAGGEQCSGKKKVGYIGYGTNNTLTFNNVTVAEDGEYEIVVYYISGEDRKFEITVNGVSQTLTGLNSGDWTSVEKKSFTATLKAGSNTITFGNSSYYAPDLDCIEVSNTKNQ